jgi:hypothetical protein
MGPTARTADNDVGVDPYPRERAGEEWKGASVIAAQNAEVVDRHRLDLMVAKLGKGPVGLVERGKQLGVGESPEEGQDDPLCSTTLRQVVMNDGDRMIGAR